MKDPVLSELHLGVLRDMIVLFVSGGPGSQEIQTMQSSIQDQISSDLQVSSLI